MDWVPQGGKRRRISQIKLYEVLQAQAGSQGGRQSINPLSGLTQSNNLSTQQAASGLFENQLDIERRAPGKIIGPVASRDPNRVGDETTCNGLASRQTRATNRQVENFLDRAFQSAREMALRTGQVVPDHSTLSGRSRAQGGKEGLARNKMLGLGAIAGSKNAMPAGLPGGVDLDGSAKPTG